MIRLLIFVLATTMLASSTTASGSVRVIWAVNDGEKVERDDLNNPNKSFNSTWDGHKIKIFGALNEIIAFQVIVETDQDGVTALSVALPELRQGTTKIKYVAPQLDPTIYAHRRIELRGNVLD